MIPDDWPAELRAFVRRAWGEVRAVAALGGLSGARVCRLDAERGSAVVKQCGAAEAACYEHLAPTLRAAGVGVPELWWSGQDRAGHWLLIEHLPATPPRSAWLGNQDWMRTLRRLHALPPTLLAALPAFYRPPTPGLLADAAAQLLPEPHRKSFRNQLAALDERVGRLMPVLISGDPNPANWGLRADGQAVLFDWERVGLGPAAFDLAITVPGLGSVGEAQQIARAYLAATGDRQPDAGAVHTLASEIARCKLWVVAEFMATVVERGLVLAPAYAELWRSVPEWAVQMTKVP